MSSKEIDKTLLKELIKSVLTESWQQLTIINTIQQGSDTLPKLEYKPLEERIESPLLDNKLKLKQFLLNISSTIQTTIKELNVQSYNAIKDFVKICKTISSEDSCLMEEYYENQKLLTELNSLLENEQRSYHNQIFDQMKQTGRVKDEMEDFKLESDIKLRYVKEWHNSKNELNEISQKKKVVELEDNISKLQRSLFNERRVHKEVVLLYEELIKEKIDKLETLKLDYHKEVNEKVQLIEHFTEKYKNVSTRKAKVEAKYKILQEANTEFKAIKAKRLAQKLEKERRNKAAIQIQAWWRGTMVRKGYGKYRKKKDKKAKKKSGT